MTDLLYRKPFPGLVAFTVAFLSQWLGHGAWAFIRGVFGEYQQVASLAVGAIGAGLIWAGLKRSEVPATWMGFLGALLVWVGWFEFTFEFYAGMFRIPEYTSPTGLPIVAGISSHIALGMVTLSRRPCSAKRSNSVPSPPQKTSAWGFPFHSTIWP